MDAVRGTLPFVVGTMVLVLVANTAASVARWGPASAAVITGAVGLLLWGWALMRRDARLIGWLVLGYAAGVTELLADWWLVNRTGSLIYPAGEPMIVVSPLYMPFAWGNILAQLGYLVHAIRGRFGLLAATLLGGLIAGVNIPLYEHLAKGAGWWFYRETPMLFSAPYYIIVGELMLGLPMAAFDRWMDRLRWPSAVPVGVLEGLGILVAYGIAWWLVGPCQGAWLQIPCR